VSFWIIIGGLLAVVAFATALVVVLAVAVIAAAILSMVRFFKG
jgi:hypothetical protein